MIRETFYEALNKDYSKVEFEKMAFKLEGVDSIYRVSFNGDYTNLKESFEKESVNLNMIFPQIKKITNEDLKKSLLSKIYHNGNRS